MYNTSVCQGVGETDGARMKYPRPPGSGQYAVLPNDDPAAVAGCISIRCSQMAVTVSVFDFFGDGLCRLVKGYFGTERGTATVICNANDFG